MKQRLFVLGLLFLFDFTLATAQPPHPLSFFPYAAGNVWQYRDASTNEIVYTRYNDTVWVGEDSSIFIRGRTVPGSPLYEKIDTAFNLFNLQFQPDYPRYKLAADSGDSWAAGVLGNDTVIITVTDVYEAWVFGVFTTIKVFTGEIVRPPPQPPFWLGDDHLASGFGLVFSFIEGGSAPYLAGAIIDSVQWGQIVSVKQEKTVPSEFMFFQNYPNPFNPTTTIRFELPRIGRVILKVYDVLGRLVSTLLDEQMQAGKWSVPWNAQHLSSGVYFARLEAMGQIQVKKLLLTK